MKSTIPTVTLCVLLMLFSCFPAASANPTPDGPSGADWWTFRGNIERNGASLSTPPSSPDVKWSKHVCTGEIWSSPVVSDGRLFIGTDEGSLYCLDAETGSTVWIFETHSYPIYSTPTVAYGMVFFGGPDLKIYALPVDDPNSDGKISDDEIIWQYTVGPSTGGINNVVCASPAVCEGKVYIGAVDQCMYCFNATSGGAPIWKKWTPFRGQHAFSSSPAVSKSKGLLYAGTGNQPGTISSGRFYAFNMSTGGIAWEFDLKDITYTTAAVSDDRIYIANSGDWLVSMGNLTYKMYCLDADGNLDGTDDGIPDSHYGRSDMIWSYNTGRYVYSSPAVHKDRIYFGCHNGNLTCLNATTGTLVWVHNTPAGGTSEPGGIMSSPSIAGGMVLAGTHDGKLIAAPLDDPNGDGKITTSELIWSYDAGSRIVSSPAVYGGCVFFADATGNVICIGKETVSELELNTAAVLVGIASVCIAAANAQRRTRSRDA